MAETELELLEAMAADVSSAVTGDDITYMMSNPDYEPLSATIGQKVPHELFDSLHCFP